jgi:hypothetical protein
MQCKNCHTQKVFANKLGFPGNRAPLVQRGLVYASGSLYAATWKRGAKACGQGVARIEEAPRQVRFPDAAVL